MRKFNNAVVPVVVLESDDSFYSVGEVRVCMRVVVCT